MRIQSLALALAIAAGLLGAAHVALTFLVYPDWTIDSLWFLGSGLAIVVAAAANVVGLRSVGRLSRTFVAAINLSMSGFFAAAWLVLPQSQVIIGGVLFLFLAACSLPAGKAAR